MLKGGVAGRYAEALYEVAVSQGMVDQLEEELSSIVQLIDQEENFRKFLFHPRIAEDDKNEVAKNVFEDKISTTAMNFIYLLINRKRENFLRDIVDVFIDFANKDRNITEAEVTSAIELSEEESKQIIEALNKVTGMEVRPNFHVDSSLIGGVVVRIGDRIIDGSIKTRFNTLREHLRQIS